MDSLEKAVSALRRGEFIIIHDGKGRENEADMVFLAEKATPEKIRTMRKDAGGLICIATDRETGERLGLEFANETLAKTSNKVIAAMGQMRMKYGDMPAFTISINHLSTFTGITDIDRAKTIREFGLLTKRKGGSGEFKRDFRAIGHVFLLVGRGLDVRRGHTELSAELAKLGKMTPALVLCEMLSDTGRALTEKEAEAYARKRRIPFIEGKQIIGALQ